MAVKSPTTADRSMGNRLRLRRKVLGLSQEKLAQALGITFQQVQKYEKGANRISASRLQDIAKILEVPVVFFFEVPATLDEAHDSDEPSFADPLLKTSGERIMQAFGEIRDERLQHLALDILMHLAKYSRSPRI
jgi:transcriptional regulator with XRE-family HTH domain